MILDSADKNTGTEAEMARVRIKDIAEQAGVSAAEAHALVTDLFGEAEKGEKR